MTCGEFSNLIYDYIDNGLDSAAKQSFEEHMENCAECKKLFLSVSEMLSLLAREGEAEPPNGFTERVMGNIKEKKAVVIPFWKRAAALVAAVCVCVIGVSAFFNVLPGQNTTEEIAMQAVPISGGQSAPNEAELKSGSRSIMTENAFDAATDEDATVLLIDKKYESFENLPPLEGESAAEAMAALSGAQIPFEVFGSGKGYKIEFIAGGLENDSPSE
ncbi:MAG: zf-HC2 domain-containing protein [Clostridia bacterium]|nr:zf-HC2 domain-containing protein [Clostridia bacterium]